MHETRLQILQSIREALAATGITGRNWPTSAAGFRCCWTKKTTRLDSKLLRPPPGSCELSTSPTGSRDPGKQRQPCLGPGSKPDRSGAVELDHRRRAEYGENAIKLGDLRPVRRAGIGALDVQGGDRRLHLIFAWPPEPERILEHLQLLADPVMLPQQHLLIPSLAEPGFEPPDPRPLDFEVMR
jgi:hypothetical protein